VNTGSLTHANGSAVVRCGDTAAVCGIRAEVLAVGDVGDFRINTTSKTTGRSLGEGDGNTIAQLGLLVPNIELATGCSPLYMPGNPPSTLAQSLSQRVLTLLHVTKLVGGKELEIWYTPVKSTTARKSEKPASTSTASEAQDVRMEESSESDVRPDSDSSARDGDAEAEEQEEELEPPQIKAFWTLYIDILFISLDGNAFDAAWAAVLAALQDVRLPRAWWDADAQTVLCSPVMAESKRLELRGLPVASTFAVFEPPGGGLGGHNGEKDDGERKGEAKYILADPDDFEESLCDEQVTVVVDLAPGGDGGGRGKGKGEPMRVLRIEKSGGEMVGVEEMRACVGMSEERWREWRGVLKGTGT